MQRRRVRGAVRWIGLSAAGLSLLAAGCYSVDAMPRAKAVAARYFAALAAGDVESALSLHHAEFYAETPAEEWRQAFEVLRERLGAPEAHVLTRRKSFVGVRSAGTGTYVSLTYAVRDAGATTEETLVLFVGSGDELPKIVSHDLRSTVFEGPPGEAGAPAPGGGAPIGRGGPATDG